MSWLKQRKLGPLFHLSLTPLLHFFSWSAMQNLSAGSWALNLSVHQKPQIHVSCPFSAWHNTQLGLIASNYYVQTKGEKKGDCTGWWQYLYSLQKSVTPKQHQQYKVTALETPSFIMLNSSRRCILQMAIKICSSVTGSFRKLFTLMSSRISRPHSIINDGEKKHCSWRVHLYNYVEYRFYSRSRN